MRLLLIIVAVGVTLKGTLAEEEKCGFIKCGDNAHCVVENRCACDEGYSGDPRSVCQRGCVCIGSGDPHFKTFDGQSLPYQGMCKYLLARPIETPDDPECWFSAEVKNEPRYGSTQVSYVRLVDLFTFGLQIRLHQGKEVLVNGEIRTPPLELADGSVKVYISGNFIIVENECGVRLQFDGLQIAVLVVPQNFSGNLEGLCGDCDGEKNDYRLADGTDVSAEPYAKRNPMIGDSWRVPDDSDLPISQCVTTEEPVECTTEESLAIFNKYCGALKDPEGKWLQHLNSNGYDVDQMYDGCKLDICSYERLAPSHLESIACESMASMAKILEEDGDPFSWRDTAFCPGECEEDMVFLGESPGCPKTCADVGAAEDETADSSCSIPPSEGCACAEGYVYSGIVCVPESECGCLDESGSYRTKDEAWVSEDCTKQMSCVIDDMGIATIQEGEIGSCHEDGICKLVDGIRTCECNVGFDGDGRKECVLPPPPPPPTGPECGSKTCHVDAECVNEKRSRCVCKKPLFGDGVHRCSKECVCVASGDPHYRQYDGNMVHFMGICKYTLTQTVGMLDECGFTIEVKNENRNGVTRVAYTRMVDVTVMGRTFRLLPGGKVEVDGRPVELPYTDVEGVRLQKSGNYVELDCVCDLTVLWDGRSMVLVEANKETYGGKVEGLCGNCNDDPSDDLTGKDGIDHTQPDKWDAYHDFGKTFRVEDDSDVPIEDEALCDSRIAVLKCDADVKEQAADMKYCGLIKTTDGPLGDCVSSEALDTEALYESCVIDYCAYFDKPESIGEVICNALSAFATSCEERDMGGAWRTADRCGMTCGENEEYLSDGCACENTCVNKKADQNCQKPSREGCFCIKGFLRSGDECIKKKDCGCRMALGTDTIKIRPGKTILLNDCKEKKECKVVGEKHELAMVEETDGCPEGRKCIERTRGRRPGGYCKKVRDKNNLFTRGAKKMRKRGRKGKPKKGKVAKVSPEDDEEDSVEKRMRNRKRGRKNKKRKRSKKRKLKKRKKGKRKPRKNPPSRTPRKRRRNKGRKRSHRRMKKFRKTGSAGSGSISAGSVDSDGSGKKRGRGQRKHKHRGKKGSGSSGSGSSGSGSSGSGSSGIKFSPRAGNKIPGSDNMCVCPCA